MLKQLLSFDNLIGAKLIAIVYYIGLIGIALMVVVAVFAIVSGNASSAQLVFMFPVPAITLVIWRFVCELGLLSFRIADDLREIKLNQLRQAPASE
jgi:hypothetical protein